MFPAVPIKMPLTPDTPDVGLKKELIKARNIIRKKARTIRRNRLQSEELLQRGFKFIVEPLKAAIEIKNEIKSEKPETDTSDNARSGQQVKQRASTANWGESEDEDEVFESQPENINELEMLPEERHETSLNQLRDMYSTCLLYTSPSPRD